MPAAPKSGVDMWCSTEIIKKKTTLKPLRTGYMCGCMVILLAHWSVLGINFYN